MKKNSPLRHVISALILTALGLPAAALPDATIVERGPHHRTWQRVRQQRMQDAQILESTSKVVELATGMHYWDGAWQEANDQIELSPEGAVARRGQHRVTFAQNLNTAGAIHLASPDGKSFRSHVLGVAFTDAASGDTVLIGQPKDTFGEVLGNSVIYRDAFAGEILGDVRYTYTRAGLEQDVILLQALPSPAEYGMNPDTTRLEVWTEFVAPPNPSVRAQVLREEPDPAKRATMLFPDLTDETLDFGAMNIGGGRAFPLQNANDNSLRVAKSWTAINDRSFLIEAVEYPTVAPLLQALRKPRAAGQPQQVRANPLKRPRLEFARSLSPPKALARKDLKPMRLASAPLSGPGLVFDYIQLNSSLTNYTFSSLNTYWITGPVNLYGTNNVLEGGTVLKFDPNTGATLDIKGFLRTDTELYRPAVLTARDDASVGELISGGAPLGYYATTALSFDYSVSGQPAALQSVRILYALTALKFTGGTGHEVRHVQIGSCGTAIQADSARYSIRNGLAWSLTNGLTGSGTSTGAWENVTFNGLTNLVSSTTGRFTNCLVTTVGNTNGIVGSSNVVLASAASVYKQVRSGYHYLADSSPYRNKGATNINATLAKELKLRTTFGPLVLTNLVTSDTNLFPQVQRDTNQVDIGYHYPPLDFIVSGLTVSNATVWATNGVALGVDYGNREWGFILQQGKFISVGSPLLFNYVGRAHMAQELSGGNPSTRACFYDTVLDHEEPPPRDSVVRLRFTEFTQLVEDGYLYFAGPLFGAIELSHCRMYNQTIVLNASGPGTLVCGLTNTHFDRGWVNHGNWFAGTGPDVKVHFRNNLFRHSGMVFEGGNTNWTVRDNVFDALLVLAEHIGAVNSMHNAYNNMTATLAGGLNDLILTNLTYETGTLGKFYQPADSPLLNVGSRTADLAGLFHFTTTTNQVKEANSQVDIGLHYVALNAQGQPVDSNSDGIPDYQADINGNGTWESGEIVWFPLSPFNVLITFPDPNAILP